MVIASLVSACYNNEKSDAFAQLRVVVRSHDRDNCCIIHSHKLLRFQQAQAVAISAMRFHLMNFKKIFKLAFMMCVTTRNVLHGRKTCL